MLKLWFLCCLALLSWNLVFCQPLLLDQADNSGFHFIGDAGHRGGRGRGGGGGCRNGTATTTTAATETTTTTTAATTA